jgi:hypothetical protein
MNLRPAMQDHDPLSPLLRQWTVDAPLPAGFGDRVWERVHGAEARSLPLYLRLRQWIEVALARPAVAAVYLSVLLFLGLALGQWEGHRQTVRREGAWRALYVQAVDPYQAPRN